MHTKIKKGKDLPSAAVESPAHDRQRGRAWFRPPTRPANPLRHPSSGRAGPPHRRLCCASRPRLHEQAARRTTSAGPREGEREISSGQEGRALQDKRGEIIEHEPQGDHQGKASPPASSNKRSKLQHDTRPPTHACCPPFVERGSALRSAPFSAPPPFELLREAPRRGACPLALPPRAPSGGRGKSVLAQVQGIIPPK